MKCIPSLSLATSIVLLINDGALWYLFSRVLNAFSVFSVVVMKISDNCTCQFYIWLKGWAEFEHGANRLFRLSSPTISPFCLHTWIPCSPNAFHKYSRNISAGILSEKVGFRPNLNSSASCELLFCLGIIVAINHWQKWAILVLAFFSIFLVAKKWNVHFSWLKVGRNIFTSDVSFE